MYKPVILFICTGNAGRSQMAEAMFRHSYGEKFNILSAGVEPWDHLHEMAIKLMNEDAVSIEGHFPKHVNKYINDKIDIAVTIGDRAEAETGEFRTGTMRIHWPINDPADADGTPDCEKVFRWTKNAVLKRFPELLKIADTVIDQNEIKLKPAISTVVFRPENFNQQNGENVPFFKPLVHLPMLSRAGFRIIELCCYRDDLDFPWRDKKAVCEFRKIANDLGITTWALHTPELHLKMKKRNCLKNLIFYLSR